MVICAGDFFDKPGLTPDEITALQDISWSDKLSSYYLNEIKDNKGTYDQDYELLKQQGFIKIDKK